jgi:hypothetical protein
MAIDNDPDRLIRPERGLPRDNTTLPNGRPRPLTAQENATAIRKATIRDERTLPRNVRPGRSA